jgi:hypothetical protein
MKPRIVAAALLKRFSLEARLDAIRKANETQREQRLLDALICGLEGWSPTDIMRCMAALFFVCTGPT